MEGRRSGGSLPRYVWRGCIHVLLYLDPQVPRSHLSGHGRFCHWARSCGDTSVS